MLSYGWIEGETIEAFRTLEAATYFERKKQLYSSRIENGGSTLTRHDRPGQAQTET